MDTTRRLSDAGQDLFVSMLSSQDPSVVRIAIDDVSTVSSESVPGQCHHVIRRPTIFAHNDLRPLIFDAHV